MTRKDFKLIADVLASLGRDAAHCFDDAGDRESIARRFAEALSDTNPNFDHARFIEAATNLA